MQSPSLRQWFIASSLWYLGILVLSWVLMIVIGVFGEFSLFERLFWGPAIVIATPYQLFFYDGLRSLWPWLVVHPLIIVPLLTFGLAALSQRSE